ncbi:MAG TPA: hypothetical protein VII63_09985 [Caulobacteraceae bacterium]
MITLLSPFGGAAAAQDANPAGSSQPGESVADYISHWADRVAEAQASQPHWITPIATVTPRLEQEFRYDQNWQHLGNGADLTNFDSGKGLELIPTTGNEVIFNLPPYLERTKTKPASGFGDWPVLLVKQRFISANETAGDYIVSGFLGVQAPTGAEAFTNHAWLITPTLAAGKGWGNLDIQGTIGVPIPLSNESTIGIPIVTNLALQYHFGKFFWPEIEANSTYWADGLRRGKTQIFITPGLVLGRFPLVGRTKAIIGLGYQFAVSPRLTTSPVLTPTYQHSWILTARTAF